MHFPSRHRPRRPSAFAPLPALSAATCLLGLAPPGAAQASALNSPGMPSSGDASQVDRFSSEFNPAFSFVFDFLADYTFSEFDEDGFDLQLRTGELSVNAWIDPSAWAYATIVYAEDEVVLEEGAMLYMGLGMDSTVRAGRYFVDFGKQMQAHIHELNTVDRPLVLREYLGAELSGDGLQWDQWFTAGDATAWRYSVGAFASLAPGGHAHGETGGVGEPEVADKERREFDELSFTGRLTGFTDLNESSVFQYGASGRFLPSFTVDNAAGDSVTGLSNTVAGADLTYGWRDETNTKTWTLSGEYLWNIGDLSAENAPAGGIDVYNGSVGGFYTYLDHGWNRYNNVGALWSRATTGEDTRPQTDEYELYYTRHLSEFLRLRLAATHQNSDEFGKATRFTIQLTGFVGAHAHGLNF